jgi:DNA-binding NarL/FixJ family response regulator
MAGKIRVIVADDNQVIRRRFANIVNCAADMEVVAQASCGREVMEAIRQNEADVILTDIEMENRLDGITTAMRLLEEKQDLRIIFITVHDDDNTLFSAFELGNVDYIPKTASNDEIVASIRNAYNDNISIRPDIAKRLHDEFARIRRKEASLMQVLHIISLVTPSEREIISMLIKGYKVKEIAASRYVGVATVKGQITAILRKFAVRSSADVVKIIKTLNLENYFQL